MTDFQSLAKVFRDSCSVVEYVACEKLRFIWISNQDGEETYFQFDQDEGLVEFFHTR